jgi:hypothetical protein
LTERLAREVQSVEIVKCYEHSCALNVRFQKIVMNAFKDSAETHFEFAVAQYDAKSCKLQVYCPIDVKQDVLAKCRATVEKSLREDIEYERREIICGGTAIAILVGGFVVERVEAVGQSLRCRFPNLPKSLPPRPGDEGLEEVRIHSTDSFKEFLVTLGVKEGEIKWANFDSRNPQHMPSGVAVFTNEAAARRAMQAYQPAATPGDDSSESATSQGTAASQSLRLAPQARVESTREEDWGRSIIWSVPEYLTNAAASELARQHGSVPLRLEILRQSEGQFTIKISNLPANFDEAGLKKHIQDRAPLAVPKAFKLILPKDGGKSRFAVLGFPTMQERHMAMRELAPAFADVFVLAQESSLDELKISNLPTNFDEATLKTFIQTNAPLAPPAKTIKSILQRDGSSRFAILGFTTKQNRAAAQQSLKDAFDDVSVTLTTKFGKIKQFKAQVEAAESREPRTFATKLELEEQQLPSTTLRVVFANVTDAETFCQGGAPGTKEAQAEVPVFHPDCYPRLVETAEAVAKKFGVKLVKPQARAAQRTERTPQANFAFVGNKPGKCGHAAQRFKQLTQPMRVPVGDRANQLLLDELLTDGETLSKWQREYKLVIESRHDDRRLRVSLQLEQAANEKDLAVRLAKHFGLHEHNVTARRTKTGVDVEFSDLQRPQAFKLRKMKPAELKHCLNTKVQMRAIVNTGLPVSLTLYGDGQQQGLLMARIGELTACFRSRYRLMQLDARSSCLFRTRLMAGSALLRELSTEVPGMLAEFNESLGGIELALPPFCTDIGLIEDAEKQINAMLQQLQLGETSAASCVFCKSQGSCRPLRICGHMHCKPCLQAVVKKNAPEGEQVDCPECSQRIAMWDIQQAWPDKLSTIAAQAARAWVKTMNRFSEGDGGSVTDLALCPGKCDGLVPTGGTSSYSHCSLCGDDVCPKCKIIDDPLHHGVTCERFRELSVRSMSRRKLDEAMQPDQSDPEVLAQAIKEAERVGLQIEPDGAALLATARQHLDVLRAEELMEEKRRLERQRLRLELAEYVEVGLGEVVDRAKTWVQKEWPETLPNIKLVRPNPGLVKGCPSVQRFARAVNELAKGKVGGGRQAVLDKGFFAWHGTASDVGITGICHEGFNPEKRSGQAHGKGEYFAPAHRAEVSIGYSGGKTGNGHMIVALILQEPSLIKTVCLHARVACTQRAC